MGLAVRNGGGSPGTPIFGAPAHLLNSILCCPPFGGWVGRVWIHWEGIGFWVSRFLVNEIQDESWGTQQFHTKPWNLGGEIGQRYRAQNEVDLFLRKEWTYRKSVDEYGCRTGNWAWKESSWGSWRSLREVTDHMAGMREATETGLVLGHPKLLIDFLAHTIMTLHLAGSQKTERHRFESSGMHLNTRPSPSKYRGFV